MKKISYLILFACFFLGTNLSVLATIHLPAILGDQMVLQQQTQVNLWGKATAKETVTITPSWTKQIYQTKSDKEGNFLISILTPKAGGPYEITISDGTPTTLKDILIGEVWLCSGQSNMEMPMKGFPNQPVVNNQETLLKCAPNTPIRMFTVARKMARTPENDCKGAWSLNTPQKVAETSATAYFFAQYLQEMLQVPIGIIVSSWGGTRVEPWMSPESLKQFPQIDLNHLQEKGELKNVQAGSVLYQGMLQPIKNMTIKGAIWYQGESNRNNPALYEQLFPVFVQSLRKLWNQGEFPFYYVQIAPYQYEGVDSLSGAKIREVQSHCMNLIPNCGMAVTMDIGMKGCIHPCHKKEVGHRLAYWALAKDYNKPVFAYAGPRYKEMSIEGNTAILTFTDIPNGISPLGENLANFEIAGSDKIFYPAKANVDHKSSTVHVSSDKVQAPVAVRYGFKNFVVGSLFDNYGNPASSFRTDNW